jgi:membrane-associated protease RseP (regulator of RpoE activity)
MRRQLFFSIFAAYKHIMNRHFVSFILLLLLSLSLSAQNDVLMLMNGRTEEGKVISIKDEVIKFEQARKGRTKVKDIEFYRVFSILYGDGRTQVLYVHDTLIGNDYTVEEMHMFILGEKDAQKYYKAPGATVLAFLMAGTGGFFLAETFLVVLVPFTTITLNTVPGVRVNPDHVVNAKYINEEPYRSGYKRVAKSKRIQNAVKGSIVGVLAGLSAYHFVFKKMDEE